MKRQLVRMMTLVAGIAAAFTSAAVDGIANNTTGSGWTWPSSQYWFDKDGQPLGTYPHEAGDTAYILCESNLLRTVLFSPKESFANFALKSVGGGFMHELQFYAPNGTGAYPVQRLTIENPNGFSGFWGTYNGNGRDEIVLDGADGQVPRLSNYEITGRMGLNVPAGKTAAVGTLFGEGALYATGSGALTVERTPGSEAILFATNGTVEVVGRATADDDDSPAPGAWAHFDASDETTYDTYAGEDGYEHVWRWRDADGGEIVAVSNKVEYAGEQYLTAANTPYLCDAAVSPSGLTAIDFGDLSSLAAPTSPVNCFLKLSKSNTNVREVFYAGQFRSNVGASLVGSIGNDRTFMVGNGSSLVHYTAPDASRYGDLRVNGQKVTHDNVWKTRHGTSLLDFHVASISIADDSEATGGIAFLGSRACLTSETGNVRIGELLVYTNKLTASQRLRVTQYLMKKWLTGAEREDFGAAALGTASSDAAISVPAGNTARIGAVTVRSGTLVKKGEGILSVGRLAPSNATISVQGGSVCLRAPRTVATTAPAANPYFWLDAEVADSIVTQKLDYAHLDADTYYVTRWNDCRGAGHDVYAEVPIDLKYSVGTYPTNFPTVVEAVANGRRAVNFGKNESGGKASFMWLQPHGTANAYEGFIAFKFNRSGSSNNIFGSTGTDLYRANSGRLLDISNTSPSVIAGLWLWDGDVLDPWQGYTCFGNTDFHVVSFSGTAKVKADLLAKDRIASANFPGDQCIGEFILYDRRLTPEERRATTAYLMKKWLGRDLPDTSATAASDHSLAYADDTTVVIDTADDVEGLKVSGGNGAIVKKGLTAVSLDSFTALNAVDSIVVEEGTLAVPVPAGIDDRDALFHYDAMDLDGMTFKVVEEGGKTVSNVTHWVDVRRKDGVFAHSTISALGEIAESFTVTPATVDPTLMTVQMPDGSWKPTVDFGKTVYSGDGGAAMEFNKVFNNVMEIHTIFADNASSKGGTIVGGRGSTAAAYGFMREYTNNGGHLLSGSAAVDAKNGYIAVDGEVKDGSYVPDLSFHLISYAPLSAQQAGTFSHERTSRCGGSRISEQIAFSTALSAEKRAYLENYMMWKWGIRSERPLDATIASLAAASGARLDLGKAYVSATALSGAGTIAADLIADVSAITVFGAVGKLTVEGSVVLANGELTLAFTDSLAALPAGEHVVFEADEIDASGLTGFQFVGTMPRNKIVGARVDGNRIILKVEKKGSIILLR